MKTLTDEVSSEEGGAVVMMGKKSNAIRREIELKTPMGDPDSLMRDLIFGFLSSKGSSVQRPLLLACSCASQIAVE